MRKTKFIVYVIVTIVALIILLFFSWKMGDRFLFINMAIVGIFGIRILLLFHFHFTLISISKKKKKKMNYRWLYSNCNKGSFNTSSRVCSSTNKTIIPFMDFLCDDFRCDFDWSSSN